MTDETVKIVEHYIEGPRKPVLQEKQVFLVFKKEEWFMSLLLGMQSSDAISTSFEPAWKVYSRTAIRSFRLEKLHL